MEKTIQKSLLSGIVKNDLALMALKSQLSADETVFLITTDVFSDIIIRCDRPIEGDLGDLKHALSCWTKRDPASDRHIMVSAVYMFSKKRIRAVFVDRAYALGEFDLLAEDIYLLFENGTFQEKFF